ncbi:hypothetical protein L798_10637 [Zootermopsis nevadensis]|uniref:Uncharacterized protein n=1 Tax=Zootermopsis nevadensis TaxID=136037 RepID=A0A067R057_ZOONE|nr:hypothetical protein L798_10637 [Zootermopsis nevadensis]
MNYKQSAVNCLQDIYHQMSALISLIKTVHKSRGMYPCAGKLKISLPKLRRIKTGTDSVTTFIKQLELVSYAINILQYLKSAAKALKQYWLTIMSLPGTLSTVLFHQQIARHFSKLLVYWNVRLLLQACKKMLP